MQRRTALRLIAAAPWAAGGLGCTVPQGMDTQGFLLYGMMIQLSLGTPSPMPIETALGEVERLFKQQYAIIHPWQDSPLTRLNAALPTGDWVVLDPELRPWIERGLSLEKASDGYFSPAIGALVKLWGFHSSQPNVERTPPAQSDIDRLMNPPPRMSDLEWDGERIRSHNPHVQLDFNAMAEGFVAAKVMAHFTATGISQALLDTGGDIVTLGQAARRPWRIAIQNPFAEGALASVDVDGAQAIFTSGSYRKQFSYRGVRYSHVINPHTGWPSQGLVSASVLTPESTLADAAATALLAAGLQDATRLAARMGLRDLLLVDAEGTLHASPALAPRLKLVDTQRKLRLIAMETAT